jgi:hypothetical protein
MLHVTGKVDSTPVFVVLPDVLDEVTTEAIQDPWIRGEEDGAMPTQISVSPTSGSPLHVRVDCLLDHLRGYAVCSLLCEGTAVSTLIPRSIMSLPHHPLPPRRHCHTIPPSETRQLKIAAHRHVGRQGKPQPDTDTCRGRTRA